MRTCNDICCRFSIHKTINKKKGCLHMGKVVKLFFQEIYKFFNRHPAISFITGIFLVCFLSTVVHFAGLDILSIFVDNGDELNSRLYAIINIFVIILIMLVLFLILYTVWALIQIITLYVQSVIEVEREYWTNRKNERNGSKYKGDVIETQ